MYMSTAQPVKHGHAMVHLIGSDISTGFILCDAKASLTDRVKCSFHCKGGFILLQGFLYKIVEIYTAQLSKHGHAKIQLYIK